MIPIPSGVRVWIATQRKYPTRGGAVLLSDRRLRSSEAVDQAR